MHTITECFDWLETKNDNDATRRLVIDVLKKEGVGNRAAIDRCLDWLERDGGKAPVRKAALQILRSIATTDSTAIRRAMAWAGRPRERAELRVLALKFLGAAVGADPSFGVLLRSIVSDADERPAVWQTASGQLRIHFRGDATVVSHLFRWVSDTNQPARLRAYCAHFLPEFASGDLRVVDVLCKVVRDEPPTAELSAAAVSSLRGMNYWGSPFAAQLTTLISDPNKTLRGIGLDFFAWSCDDTDANRRALLPIVLDRDEDASVRRRALSLLHLKRDDGPRVHPEVGEVLSYLLKEPTEQDEIRNQALCALYLKSTGTDFEEHRDTLRDLMRDDARSLWLRIHAAKALFRHSDESSPNWREAEEIATALLPEAYAGYLGLR